MKNILILVFLCLLWIIQLQNLSWATISTHSFTNLPGRGTYPQTIIVKNKTILIDLSPIKNTRNIYRAHLFINVDPYWPDRFQKVPEEKFCLTTNIYPNKCLPTVPPRHIYFDLTREVKEATQKGITMLEIKMKTAPAHGFGKPTWHKDKNNNSLIHLDITCDLPLPSKAPQPEIPVFKKVYSKDGDTLLLWSDPSPLTTKENITVKEYKSLLKEAEGPPHQVRFRIYRSKIPITPETIINANLIDEVDPLTVWNEEFLGQWWTKENASVPRMPFEDEKIAQPGDNIYVYHNKKNGEFYYAVVKVLDGQENLDKIFLGKNSLKEPVREAPGPGLVLLRKKEIRNEFYYVKGPIELNFFVRWEAPPRANMPSTPFNYLVARSLNPKHQPNNGKHPVNINLHCWGGSLLSGFLWWYEAENGSLLVTTNQRPYDWWTGYNEAMGTYLSFSDHPVYNYTQKRIESFLKDVVFKNWPINKEKIILSGNSMGGSGTIMWGLRRPDLFAYIIGNVGVYIPAESPIFTKSFYEVYGNPAWPVKYVGTDLTPYEYWDTKRFLYENPSIETPFIIFANGRNDNAIGWSQAWKVAKALQETKKPVVFRWTMEGHSTRAHFPGGGDRWPTLNIEKKRSLPAFSNFSLDDPLGNTPDDAPERGSLNYYLLWKAKDIVDVTNRWEITIYLSKKAPKNFASVDITPRRLQEFKIQKGKIYYWENFSLKENKVTQSGTIVPDKFGLLTIKKFLVSKTGNILRIFADHKENNLKVLERLEERNFSKNTEDIPTQLSSKTQLFANNNISKNGKIVISPLDANFLSELINRVPEGTTIYLKDGEYKISKTWLINKNRISLRSLSGDPEKVIITGDYKIGELINIQASEVTLNGLTLKNALYHAIHIGGGAHKVRLIKLHILDCGEQLIKVNPNKEGKTNDYGLLANSILEFTDEGRKKIKDPFKNGSCYTSAIDILKARGWHISENIFRNIYCESQKKFPQTVLVWQGSRDTIVEKNYFINCPISIQFGLGWTDTRVYTDLNYTAPHIAGIIRNNFIFVDENHILDTGIGLWGAKDTIIINNTIYTRKMESFTSIDLRFPETEAIVWNNLLFKPPLLREGASANIKANIEAEDFWFIDPENGDLHLKEDWPEIIDKGEAHYSIKFDIDEEKREGLPDIGADEWTGISLKLDQMDKKRLIVGDSVVVWVDIFPQTTYKELFLWAETPNGKWCYNFEDWIPCNDNLLGMKVITGSYPIFHNFQIPGTYKIFLASDKQLDGTLEEGPILKLKLKVYPQ